MMKRNIEHEIKMRFFEVLDTLAANKVIRGVGTFAKMHGLNASNLRNLRYQDNWSVSAEYIYYIVRDFGINSQWLITGNGPMFSDENLAISTLKKRVGISPKSKKKCENTCLEEKKASF